MEAGLPGLMGHVPLPVELVECNRDLELALIQHLIAEAAFALVQEVIPDPAQHEHVQVYILFQ